MIRSLGILIMFVFCQQSMAGGGGIIVVGNGGDGVVIQNKVYLLDLLESGLHQETDANILAQCDSKSWVAKIEKILNKHKFPIQSIACKFSQIETKSNGIAILLYQKMSEYNWNLTPLGLLNVQDEDEVVDLQSKKLVQLAIRRSNSIFLDLNLWNRMDILNKTALVFHEIIYASIDPNKFRTGARAREINAYIFNELFEFKTSQQFYNFIGDSFPASNFFKIDFNRQNFVLPASGFSVKDQRNISCAELALVKGFSLKYGGFIDQIRLICFDISTESITKSNLIGGTGGEYQPDVSCPDGYFVSALNLFFDKNSKNNPYLLDLSFSCRSLNSDLTLDIPRMKQSQVFGRVEHLRCPSGFVGTMSSNYDLYLRSLAIGCLSL